MIAERNTNEEVAHIGKGHNVRAVWSEECGVVVRVYRPEGATHEDGSPAKEREVLTLKHQEADALFQVLMDLIG